MAQHIRKVVQIPRTADRHRDHHRNRPISCDHQRAAGAPRGLIHNFDDQAEDRRKGNESGKTGFCENTQARCQPHHGGGAGPRPGPRCQQVHVPDGNRNQQQFDIEVMREPSDHWGGKKYSGRRERTPVPHAPAEQAE